MFGVAAVMTSICAQRIVLEHQQPKGTKDGLSNRSVCKYCGSNHVKIGERCRGCGAWRVE